MENHITDWTFTKDTTPEYRELHLHQGRGYYKRDTEKFFLTIFVQHDDEQKAEAKVIELIEWIKANDQSIKEFLFAEQFTEEDEAYFDFEGVSIWYDNSFNVTYSGQMVGFATHAYVKIDSNFNLVESGIAD
jgi:N-methylhydantoinase B/oxoprolinase/acetone carboxylase alpha subunit